jgi:O-antigen ligase
MAFSTLLANPLSVSLTLGGLGAIFVPWLIKVPRLALGFLLFSLLAGQLIRLPLPGQGGGLLLSDLAIVIVLLCSSLQLLSHFAKDRFAVCGADEGERDNSAKLTLASQEEYSLRLRRDSAIPLRRMPCQRQGPPRMLRGGAPSSRPKLKRACPTAQQLLIVTTPFILWSLFTLLIKSPNLGLANTLIAVAYWLRLTALLLLLPALTTILFFNPSHRQYLWRGLYLVITLLIFFGALQLFFFPDLSPFTSSGWDPHQFRLVSTWIDPNFLGAFLAIGLIVFFLGPNLTTRQRAVLILITIFALFTTQSRSALIATIFSLLLVMPLFFFLFLKEYSKDRLFFLASAISLSVLLVLLVIITLLPRFTGLVSVDPTVEARLTSIQKALPIITNNSLLGVGYNAYQFAAQEAGIISNYQVHSRAGTDNSLLTIWATTGLIGLLLFFIPWIYISYQLLSNLWQHKLPVSLGGISCVSILFIHSQFVNSFIYSHLLITLIIVISLALSAVCRDGTKPFLKKPQ